MYCLVYRLRTRSNKCKEANRNSFKYVFNQRNIFK